MLGSYQKSLSLVLASEGGFVNRADDPGGATNKGITLATFRQFVKPSGSIADLQALTAEQAGIVYRAQYWAKVAGDDLPAGVDYAVFDFAVNSGPKQAATSLQRVIGAAMDGVIGPNTLAAVRDRPPAAVITMVCNERLRFLERLPTWPTFGKGWAARVARVQADALRMAA